MMEMVLKLKPPEQTKVVLLLWIWWDERNKRREEGRRRTAMEVAYVMAAQTDKLNGALARCLLSENRQASRWEKPAPGEIKLNSDGAFFSSSGDGGWGFVIRDEEGAVLKAGIGREDHLQDAFHAELLGCEAGLKAAAAMGITTIAIETDAAMVKEALVSEEYRLSTMGGVITDLKQSLLTEFAVFRVRAVPRSCNRLAHSLAALGCKLSSGAQSFWDDVP